MLSVSQFAADNNVYLEFHPKTCSVKDKFSNNILLHGKLHNGLYKFDSFDFRPERYAKTCYSAVDKNLSQGRRNIQFDFWHRKLGHPSVNIVIKYYN